MQSLRRTTLTAVLLSLGFAALARADTIHVCWDGSADYVTIQEGIDAAFDGDEVVVCNGTYAGPGNKDLDFDGKAITVRSENGPQNCIIDCEGEGRGFYFHSGEDRNSVVEGFTITHGDPVLYGGAVFCQGSSPTMVNCIFKENSAGHGGGMTNEGSSPMVVNCLFVGNTVRGHAGGMNNLDNSNPQIINCTFTCNRASAPPGGMANVNSEPVLTNCILWGDSPGGEIAGPATVTYSCVQSGCEGEGNIDCDPLFVNPGYWDDNGTPDDPSDDFWVEGNYHLSPGSCAIDAGDTSAVDCPAVFGDLDGYARVVDDPLTSDTGIPGGLLDDVVDMGAYEYKLRIPGDIDGDGCVDQVDLGILLANWGMGCP